LVGVAVELKETANGAWPEEGEAEAVQASEQTGTAETVMVPDLVQVTPCTEAVMYQL
jgi:hypothetical protein